MILEDTNILGGVIIGAVGGGIAGLVIWLADLTRKGVIKRRETKRVESWLEDWLEASPNDWCSTTALASHNNLTKDRVRYLCSYSKKITLNKKDGNKSKEVWQYIG